MTRPDAPLIRHLCKTLGTEAGRVYDRLPLFVLLDEADELIGHEAELLEALGPEEIE